MKSPYEGGIAGKTHAGRTLWRCAWCGRTGFWAEGGWTCYGSLLDEEHGNHRGTPEQPSE